MPKRALTGIQPSGTPHVGNWLGAIKPGIALQDQGLECFYFVASYHALTTTRDAPTMQESVLDVAATWLAMGLDPARTVLWNQHAVPEVCELSWILGCVLSKSSLDKATAFKDAVAKGKTDLVNVGLYTYPVLMAADILAYDSHLVPVGKDQKQHLEMARDMAQRFNRIFGETLVVPEPLIRDEVALVPGIDGQKMSKSYNNDVALFLPKKKLRKRLMAIQTDSTPMEAPKDPAACNVFALYKLFASAEQTQDLADRYRAGGLGYGHAKQALFEQMDAQLAEPRERYHELRKNPDAIKDILEDGASRARAVAHTTLSRVRSAVGLD